MDGDDARCWMAASFRGLLNDVLGVLVVGRDPMIETGLSIMCSATSNDRNRGGSIMCWTRFNDRSRGSCSIMMQN